MSGSVDFDGDGQTDFTSSGLEDIFVAQYDAQGTFQWVEGGGNFFVDKGIGIGTDGTNNVYVTGVFSGNVDLDGDGQLDLTGSSFTPSIFTVKYDATGALQWAIVPGAGSGEDIDVNSNGVSVLTGSFQGNADFDEDGQTDVSVIGSADIFIASYDASGGLQWVRGAGGTEFDVGFGAAVDASGNGYVTGYFQSSQTLAGADFDGDGQVDVTGESFEVFIAKYDASGMLEQVYSAGGDLDERGFGIDLDDAGNAYITGYYSSDSDFDGDGQTDIFSRRSRTDIFAARYDAAVLPVELAGFGGRADGDAAVLTWTTVSETNNAGFFVEQATGPSSWTTLGRVEGAGTTSEVQRYQFRTGILAPGVHRFRLRQVDIDGTVSYSRATAVNLSLAGAYASSRRFPIRRPGPRSCA